MTIRSYTLSAALGLGVAACAAAIAGSGTIPTAVKQSAANLAGPGAKIEQEGNEFEVATTTRLELELGVNGEVRETEIAVPVASLPAAVSKAVTAALAPGETIGAAELHLTADGVFFEIEAGRRELVVDAAGATVGEEHEDGDSDDDDDDDRR